MSTTNNQQQARVANEVTQRVLREVMEQIVRDEIRVSQAEAARPTRRRQCQRERDEERARAEEWEAFFDGGLRPEDITLDGWLALANGTWDGNGWGPAW